MIYHRLNLKTNGQDADKFKTVRNSKTAQLAVIVPSKELDVIVKSKKGNSSFMNNQQEDVHFSQVKDFCDIGQRYIGYRHFLGNFLIVIIANNTKIKLTTQHSNISLNFSGFTFIS